MIFRPVDELTRACSNALTADRAEAGVQRVMLQCLDLDDIDGLEALARGILSK